MMKFLVDDNINPYREVTLRELIDENSNEDGNLLIDDQLEDVQSLETGEGLFVGEKRLWVERVR